MRTEVAATEYTQQAAVETEAGATNRTKDESELSGFHILGQAAGLSLNV